MTAAREEPGSTDRGLRAGVAYAIAAYGSWGVVPLFWKLLGEVDAAEILAHRVAWSMVLVSVMLLASGRGGAAWQVLRSRPKMKYLAVSSVLIAINWGLFIWAVSAGRLVDASLGYFMNPLVNVVLGVALLREKLIGLHRLAVALAGVGLLVMLFTRGSGLGLSLALAATFALYGLCRKVAPVDSLVGLFVETLLCFPLALAYLAHLELSGHGVVASGHLRLLPLLMLAGPVTALPFASFAAAARRLPLSRLGFFQYLSPSLQFALAVFAFGEHVEPARILAFGIVWVALALSTFASLRAHLRGP